MPELLNPTPVAHLRHLLRAHSPLVHCMTNDVVQTFTANVLLAVGASPAMVIDPREAAQFAAIADALLINVGTLTEDRAVAMRAAVEHARQAGKPWTLDPVAVTGEVDYVTDGERVLSVAGGNPLMTRVVGTGCALSAVVAASAALPGDRLENVAAACGLMKQAGEIAARQGGPGSFIPAFLDALYQEVQG